MTATAAWTATGALTPLFNPRADAWATPFSLVGGIVVPKTAIARATVALLRVNAPARVEIRDALVALDRWLGDVTASG